MCWSVCDRLFQGGPAHEILDQQNCANLVLRDLKVKHTVNEMILQLLVAEIDAELLKGVDRYARLEILQRWRQMERVTISFVEKWQAAVHSTLDIASQVV